MLAGQAALRRRRARSRAHEIRQAGEILLALELERVALLVREHVLAERGAERREPFVDLGEPRFRGAFERCACALEHG